MIPIDKPVLTTIRSVEKRPIFGTELNDLDQLRLQRHFRHRYPDCTSPDDCRVTLTAHKLAVGVEGRVLPASAGLFCSRNSRSDCSLVRSSTSRSTPTPRQMATPRSASGALGPLMELIGQTVSRVPTSPLTDVRDVGGLR